MQNNNQFVIPAHAGIQSFENIIWIPACAGMTTRFAKKKFSGNNGQYEITYC